MEKILVTGGAGYIGSHAVRKLLSHGYKNITVIDDLSTGKIENIPPTVNFIKGDFCDPVLLKKAFKDGCDSVIHFAAFKKAGESVEKPLKYYENNVLKSIYLLDYCLKNNVKYFIFSSSAAVYGDVQEFPIIEEFITNPTNPYGWSKLMFEQILKDASSVNDLKHVSLRYFNAGGADSSGEVGNNHRDSEDIISALMRSANNGTPFSIFGTNYPTKDGTCIRDLIHVNDLASAHIKALEYLEKGGGSITLNLGSEEGFSVKEIVEKTKQITGTGFEVKVGPPRLGDVVVSIASSKKAKELLAWEKEFALEDIIKTSWLWERGNGHSTKN